LPAARERAYFRIPEHIRIVEEFPMAVNGKVQKFKIRKQESREMNLEDVARIQTV
jgi:fatty-acyl-CoA synthase